MDWSECKEKRLVKQSSADTDLITSLISSAINRAETASRLEVDEVTSATVVTLHYDTLRELLEALALKNGYKIYNHNCYCAFLKEVIHETDIGSSFDRFRRIRNDINYYGKDIEKDRAKDIISEIQQLIEELKNMLNN